jgi:hypothetical protein
MLCRELLCKRDALVASTSSHSSFVEAIARGVFRTIEGGSEVDAVSRLAEVAPGPPRPAAGTQTLSREFPDY